jgi:aspartyl-tRNA(Asn)/glutamyl-tRNA(Gln) amidotransferase subunit C
MSLTDSDVDHVARLARLALSAEEKRHYGEQLSKILDHIQTLNRYDVTGVSPLANVDSRTNVWREDVARPFGDTEAILANAPERNEVYFKVKKIIE